MHTSLSVFGAGVVAETSLRGVANMPVGLDFTPLAGPGGWGAYPRKDAPNLLAEGVVRSHPPP